MSGYPIDGVPSDFKKQFNAAYENGRAGRVNGQWAPGLRGRYHETVFNAAIDRMLLHQPRAIAARFIGELIHGELSNGNRG